MKTYRIPQTNLEVSRIGYGCGNLGGNWNTEPLTAPQKSQAVKLVVTAFEQGINLFDHADIYTQGKSETVFGMVLEQLPDLRDKIIIQSKCGIRFPNDPQPGDPGRYDFSYRHIIDSVEGSLRRLKTSHLDILLLHRPDPLVEPEEVAQAFNELQSSGKVRYFGVSNHTGAQIALLQKYLAQPLVVNQVQLSLSHVYLIDDGIVANRSGVQYAGVAGTLDYCRLHDIMLQAWSPVGGGKLLNLPAQAEERLQKTAELITQLAQAKGTSKEAIVLGWLLKHPAHIQPIIGTTNVEHLRASCESDRITLSREEWVILFVAARGAPLA